MPGGLLVCGLLALAGAAVMAAALIRWRHDAADLDQFLAGVYEIGPEERPVESVGRVAGQARTRVFEMLGRLLPRNHLDAVDRQIAQAGLTGKRRAAEQVGVQLGCAAAGAVVTVVLLPSGPPPILAATLLLLPVIGFILPSARLKKKIRVRSEAIFKDLPDIVDMLAIAVEAGSGFEAALSMVCRNFASPLTDELSMALREMELGMPRRDALLALKARSDLDAVRMLALSLLQADALGVPIGRVLRGQATEVRARRRAWAREKAAKMPVKILFPLVLFIFPPILALVLGPAAFSLTQLGH